jgi:very-short-patch-repair endonuclease
MYMKNYINKQCSKCKETKSPNDFNHRNKGKWLMSVCKSCDSIARHIRTEKQCGHVLRYSGKWYTKEEMRILKQMYDSGASYEEMHISFPNRTQHALETKLSIMGVSSREKYFRKRTTFIEIQVRRLLVEWNLVFQEQVRIRDTVVDFIVRNIIIEVNGSYWHGDLNKFTENNLNYIQKQNRLKDKYKKSLFMSLGYNIIYIWEYDLEENFEKVKSQLHAVLLSNKWDNNRPISVEIFRDNTEITQLIS